MEEKIFGPGAHLEPVADIEARIAAGEGAFYIVMRCADMPSSEYPPIIRDRLEVIGCPDCHEPCWYDPQTFIRGTIPLCLRCLQRVPGKEHLNYGTSQEAADLIRQAKREAE